MTAPPDPSVPTKPDLAVILAGAGEGRRMGSLGPKLLLEVGGKPALTRVAATFLAHPAVAEIVAVVPQDLRADAERALRGAPNPRATPITTTAGGATRQGSVKRGLDALAPSHPFIAVHDVARVLVSTPVIDRTLRAARATGAAIPALPITDTVKEADNNQITRSIPRDRLLVAQTPQIFHGDILRRAHAGAETASLAGTDEASLVEAAGHAVTVVPGDPRNLKLTVPEDLVVLNAYLGGGERRIGTGYDVHRLEQGLPLVLGGVSLPSPVGLRAHSDGDALSHAIGDAILGALGLGDLGSHFPDSDARWRGASSLGILESIRDLAAREGARVVNIDATLIAEAPKIAPYVSEMRENLGRALGIEPGRVSVKATTHEGIGSVGRGEGIAAMAVALLEVTRP